MVLAVVPDLVGVAAVLAEGQTLMLPVMLRVLWRHTDPLVAVVDLALEQELPVPGGEAEEDPSGYLWIAAPALASRTLARTKFTLGSAAEAAMVDEVGSVGLAAQED
jgi:hypothetical protein